MAGRVGRPMTDEPRYGPAMMALTEKQRAFVLAMASDPLGSRTDWARAAGYSDLGAKVAAFHNMQKPKIQAAVFEVARATIFSVGPVIAVHGLIAVAKNPAHKHHLRACEMLANRCGLQETTESHVTVEHRDMSGAELERRVKQLSAKYGLDATKLLGAPKENGSSSDPVLGARGERLMHSLNGD